MKIVINGKEYKSKNPLVNGMLFILGVVMSLAIVAFIIFIIFPFIILIILPIVIVILFISIIAAVIVGVSKV